MKLTNDVLQGASICRRKLRGSISGLSIVIVMCGVLGCTSTVRFMPVDFCSQSVNPAMARIVMSRESSSYGGAIGLRIFDNGQPIGDIGRGGRLCWDRFPGKAVINGQRSDSKRTLPDLEQEQSWRVKVETKANATYYVHSSMAGQWELRAGPD